uniref:HAT C-terminal dimerisation domain-containing protein n=1 Tax=Romanomermis culicivorax TaxID=13658 RepID=A0A915JHA8_ROMCU
MNESDTFRLHIRDSFVFRVRWITLQTVSRSFQNFGHDFKPFQWQRSSNPIFERYAVRGATLRRWRLKDKALGMDINRRAMHYKLLKQKYFESICYNVGYVITSYNMDPITWDRIQYPFMLHHQLGWWELKSDNYPWLAALAGKYLAIHVTNVDGRTLFEKFTCDDERFKHVELYKK